MIEDEDNNDGFFDAYNSWVSCKDQMPEEGKKIYYYSIMGTFIGYYKYGKPTKGYTWDEEGNQIEVDLPQSTIDIISPHTFFSEVGHLDTDEVTHWRYFDEEKSKYWIPMPPDWKHPNDPF